MIYRKQIDGNNIITQCYKQSNSRVRTRKKYMGIGYTYENIRNIPIPLKSFNSWVLNESTCQWESPVAMPSDDKMYSWDEKYFKLGRTNSMKLR